MKFFGRERELAALAQAYRSGRSTFFPIYGRRRVGKTELILQFLKDKPGIYFLGKQAPAAEQIREFQENAAASFNEPLLADRQIDGWKKALTQVMARRPKGRKCVLVFDEFQWSAAASPELPSVLQELWDLQWSRTDDVFLILCGSYIGFMERNVLGNRSPLFGRRSGQIQLAPFNYDEAARFHPGLAPADLARTWFLCGGIPFYLQLFDGRQSIAANIQKNFLDPYGPLYREAEFLIREELREVDRYQTILMGLAHGSRRAIEIAQRSGIGPANVQYYLKHLLELGYIDRRFPLTTRKPRAHEVRYRVSDPVLQFWFRFVFPHASRIVSLRPASAYDQLIRGNLDAYFGQRFEALCRQALPRIYQQSSIETPFEMGEYWDQHVQIDLVAVRGDGRVDIGECRWATVRSWPAVFEELRQRMATYSNPDNRTLQGWVFSRQKCPVKEPRYRLIALEDFYG